MASPLVSQIRKQVATAAGPQLLAGTLRRVGSTTMDANGDPVPGTVTTYTFRGFRDDYSAFYRKQAGIPAEDAKILVLLGTVTPVVEPRKGDQLKLENTGWHQVREIPKIDPAGATAECQSYEIEDPS